MIWNLILIQFICVMLVDVTGVVEDLITPIVRWLTGSKIGQIGKPFSCSLCSTFWTGLIYLLCTGNFTIVNFTVVLLLACLTPVTLMLYHLAVDLFTRMVESIYNYFQL